MNETYMLVESRLSLLRNQFWIPGGLSLIRHVQPYHGGIKEHPFIPSQSFNL